MKTLPDVYDTQFMRISDNDSFKRQLCSIIAACERMPILYTYLEVIPNSIGVRLVNIE